MLEATTGVRAMPDDATLLDRTRGGDPSAREELFRRHFSVAYAVAYRLLGNEQDALDAVQDGLLKAVLHIDDFDGRSGFKTWLLRIVTNTALDSGRKRSRRPMLSFEDGVHEYSGAVCHDDPDLRLRNDELGKKLQLALGRLSPTLRTTFVLFAETGLSYEEIAKVQSIPKGTVMSRLHEARKRLQTYLDGVEL